MDRAKGYMKGQRPKLMEQVSELKTMDFWQRTAYKIIFAPVFDYIMGGIILINMIVMVIDINHAASEEGDDDDTQWTDVFGWFVLAIFVLELILRLLALRCSFWKDAWNIGDFVVVLVDVIFSCIGLVAGDLFPVSILRVFRLAKLARVSKVFRVFPELRLLLAGLASSMKAIFWGTVLMGLFLMVWAMMAVLLIHPLAKKTDFDGCTRCSRAYSSVWQAMLTFFQQIVTGDSWGTATIPVMEQHPITILFFVPVFLSMGLAVMNLMLGVVVTSAQTAYEQKQQELQAEKDWQNHEKQGSIVELCKEMDTDSSGELSKDEIYAGFMGQGKFHDIMVDELGITEDDFEIAWAVLDADGSGSVSYKEFVHCICNMKQSDTDFVLTYIKFHLISMKQAILQHMNEKQHESGAIEKRIEQTLAVVELQQEEMLQNEDEILRTVSMESPTQHNETTRSIKRSRRSNRHDTHMLGLSGGEGNESVLPEKSLLSSGIVQPLGSDINSDLMSAGIQSAIQVFLREVGDDLDMLRNDLKDSLTAVDRKQCRKISHIQAKLQSMPDSETSVTI